VDRRLGYGEINRNVGASVLDIADFREAAVSVFHIYLGGAWTGFWVALGFYAGRYGLLF